jgi:hypothetical protein
MKTALKALTAGLFSALACHSATAAPPIIGSCRIGIYHLRDGSDVDIGQGKGSHLRWRRKDGTSGELTEATMGLGSARSGGPPLRMESVSPSPNAAKVQSRSTARTASGSRLR